MSSSDKEGKLASGGEKGGRARTGDHSTTSDDKNGTTWRAKYPAVTGPINVLFPAPPKPDSLPEEQNATRRGAWKARKLVFRAMIASLACYILLVEPASLQALGQAAFFALIVSVMLPPIMPTPVFVLVATMLILGMCIGWAWSCAAMAAAIQARDQVLLASQLQIAQVGAAGAVNPAAEFQRSIFEGRFLDWRSTAVFAAFMAVGLFVLALLRAQNQKLSLVAIFGSIVLDVMCSYGPLFPFARYTLATQFVIPTACYIAVALASNFLLFPQSLNSSWTTDLTDKVLLVMLQRSQLYSKLLKTPTPANDAEAWAKLGPSFEASQTKLSSGFDGLLGSIPMLELEVSYGRTGAKDLAMLKPALDKAVMRSLALGSLYRTVERRRRREESLSSESADKPSKQATPRKGRPTARMQRLRDRMQSAEDTHRHTLQDLLPVLDSSSQPMRQAIDTALSGAMAWLTDTNDARWIGKKPSHEETESRYRAQKDRVAVAAAELATYCEHKRKQVCEPFSRFFDSDGSLSFHKGTLSPDSLLTVLSATDSLVQYGTAMCELLDVLLAIEDSRRVNKVWWPTGLRKIGNLLRGGKSRGGLPTDGQNPDELTLVDTDSEAERPQDEKTANEQAETEEDWVFAQRNHEARDPEARPPKNAGQKLAIRVHNVSVWIHKPETVFAIKYVVVSMLLWVPQIVPSSAFFTYEYKGLWALIMFQTGFAVFAGDQVLQTIQKMAGTAAGLLWGCVIWYIGAGLGDGNRIGLGAAFFILFLPLMTYRVLATPATQMTIMMAAVTTVLIVGYSWTNAHLFTIGNTGLGIHLAWRRALLVIIGVGAALVAMVFPRPQTTRALVRRTHATCINEIGRLYAAIISGWISEDRHDEEMTEDEPLMKDSEAKSRSAFGQHVEKAARARILAVYLKLNGSHQHIVESAYEPSLRGDWPQAEYLELLQAQLTLLQAVGQIESGLLRLEPEWRRQLTHATAFLHSELVADVVATFFLVSMALRSGSMLPEAMPGPLLDRLLYHDSRLRLFSGEKPFSQESAEMDVHTQLDGAKFSSSELTWPILTDKNFATYASVAIAIVNVLSALDEIVDIVKSLVGEASFPGYKSLAQHRHHDV
ncbi:hypothetical protein OIV83_001990 [Microbotryomycetes sp. JL201]|nr:hypothetical protein OIV83_001990 [Microbotryomycetes sp. JL201]